MFYAEKCREFLLKCGPFLAEREPEIEGGADSRLDLVLSENAACIRDRLAGGKLGAQRVVAWALSCMGEARVFARQPEDFVFEFVQRGHGLGDPHGACAAGGLRVVGNLGEGEFGCLGSRIGEGIAIPGGSSGDGFAKGPCGRPSE